MTTVLGQGKVFSLGFGARFYTAPEYYSGLGTLSLIVAVSALFNIFTAPYFINSGVLAALVVVWISQLVSVASLIVLIFRDPGIVPQSNFYREHYDPIKGQFRDRPPPMAFENAVRTFPLRSKFCESCCTVRAPRVVHCSSDDVDMERFGMCPYEPALLIPLSLDHHCPWTGCCIAKRNYKIFLCFLLALSVSVLGIIGISIAHLALYTLDDYDTSDNLSESIRTSLSGNIPVAIVCGICFVFMWFIVGLTSYHIFLSTHAMTTYEHIRGAFESLGNPYDRGAWYKNLMHVFTEPIRPSWVDLKSKTSRRVLQLESQIEPEMERRIQSSTFDTASMARISPINPSQVTNASE